MEGTMVITICKRWTFDAAHYLPHVRDDHKCKRLHGHTYAVELLLTGDPDQRGMVYDYDDLDGVWQHVYDLVDHRLLNDVPGLENPTTEVLAPWVAAKVLEAEPSLPLMAVRVYESSTTWCEVRL